MHTWPKTQIYIHDCTGGRSYARVEMLFLYASMRSLGAIENACM